MVNPKDFLLTKVVEYFNSWSDSERTIKFNQLLFIEMSFVESPIVGDSLRESIQGTQSGAPKRGPYDDFPPESLYDITCLYTGKAGLVSASVASDFLVIQFTSSLPSGPPVYELEDQDGWSERLLADSVYWEMSSQSGFDDQVVSFARTPTQDDDDRSLWIYAPLASDDRGPYDSPPIQRLRPLFRYVEREFKITLDDTTTADDRLGEVISLTPFLLDGTLSGAGVVNQKTSIMPTDSGSVLLRLCYDDKTSNVASFSVQMSPSDTYIDFEMGYESQYPTLRTSNLWFELEGTVPEGASVEITLVLLIKERFLSTDFVADFNPV